jgi:hypothetical protein
MRRLTAGLAVGLVAGLGGTATALAQDACEVARKVCAGEMEAGSGPYYQLVGMSPQPNTVVPEWKVAIDSGRIALETPFGRSECTWAPASVDRIYAEGVDITLRAEATSTVENNSVGAFIQLVQGFGPNADLGPRNAFEARAGYGETATDEQVLHIDPHLPNAFAKVGDRVSIDIGGCEAGTMTYIYEYRE